MVDAPMYFIPDQLFMSIAKHRNGGWINERAETVFVDTDDPFGGRRQQSNALRVQAFAHRLNAFPQGNVAHGRADPVEYPVVRVKGVTGDRDLDRTAVFANPTVSRSMSISPRCTARRYAIGSPARSTGTNSGAASAKR